jgi:biotin operon repressor
MQTWIALGPTKVDIPFAKELAALIPPIAVRLRRDFPTLLNLIRAHALLHQATRERNPNGKIVAEIRDYAAVRKLVVDLISEGIQATVSQAVRETVNLVADLDHGDGVAQSVLATKLDLDRAAISRRVAQARRAGYLVNDEMRKGHPAKLAIGEPMPEKLEILPTPEVVEARCCSVDPRSAAIDAPPPPRSYRARDPQRAERNRRRRDEYFANEEGRRAWVLEHLSQVIDPEDEE